MRGWWRKPTPADRLSIDDPPSSRTKSEDQPAPQSRTVGEPAWGTTKSIHVPCALYRELRHLTQLRDTFVSEMVGMKQRIQSLLLFEGIEFPGTRRPTVVVPGQGQVEKA